MRRKNMLRSLSLSLAALLMTTPVWAQENSAADVVENQTMTIGGKEQIVTKAALEKAQKAQKGKGKDKGGLSKKGKKTVYYMHNKPSEDISDPRYKGTTEEQPAEAGDAEQQEEAKRPVSRQEAEKEAAREDAAKSAQEAVANAPQTNTTAVREEEPPMRPPAEIEKAAAPYFGQLVTKIMVSGNNVTPTEEIINVLKTKPGMTLTSEGLGKDLYAIYNMGWFYDLQPEFKQVPEGVQVTYHVMENPIYQQLAVDLHMGKEEYFAKRDEIIKTYKASGRRKEIQEALKELKKSYKTKVLSIPEDLCWLYGEFLEDYLHDVEICQSFAKRNREKMAEIILEEVGDAQHRTLMITHCNAPDRAETIKKLLTDKVQFRDCLIMDTRGVSSMYANDGGVIVTV